MGQKPIRVPKVRPRRTATTAAAPPALPGVSAYDAFRAAIASMPDEALGWLIVRLHQQPVWPDGLGGFRPESQAAIRAALAAVEQLR